MIADSNVAVHACLRRKLFGVRERWEWQPSAILLDELPSEGRTV